MTATVISSLLGYSEVSKKNKMLNFTNNTTTLDELQLKTSVPCSIANPSPYIPTGSLLDGQVAGDLSAREPFQRRHSISLPNGKNSPNQFIDSLKMDPALPACVHDKENCFRERSYSETGDRPRPGGQVNSSRYKTELCRPFEENGACKYGDKCQFAHGMNELRCLNRHPKYKTELCRTFHTVGFCPYGRRCDFIHNAEERRGPPQLSDVSRPVRPRLQHSVSFAGFPTCSRTPPPVFSTEDLTEWQGNPFVSSAQDFTDLTEWQGNPFVSSAQDFTEFFGPILGQRPAPQLQVLSPSSPSGPIWKTPSSPPESLSDQEGYQSSLSGSESPILDATRRLPIFSRLSISDD